MRSYGWEEFYRDKKYGDTGSSSWTLSLVYGDFEDEIDIKVEFFSISLLVVEIRLVNGMVHVTSRPAENYYKRCAWMQVSECDHF
ncbi:hypothetical protein AVEN_241376-1 [Araneus ventricosus]|uniref:Uncharacterized protein n=1 Tax=Araneus ventricosus TaxID=182803 RepID=A0A4Y2WD22_ARAVE|nr:hypothetical protein AVEN_241376-1 [Araneus ventricosus]